MNIIYEYRQREGLLQQELAELINETGRTVFKNPNINVKKQNIYIWEQSLVESIKSPLVPTILEHLIGCPKGEVNRNLAEMYYLKKGEC